MRGNKAKSSGMEAISFMAFPLIWALLLVWAGIRFFFFLKELPRPVYKGMGDHYMQECFEIEGQQGKIRGNVGNSSMQLFLF